MGREMNAKRLAPKRGRGTLRNRRKLSEY